LKDALTHALVLRLPLPDLRFKVHTDASTEVLGAVLLPESKLVAYESKKLNNIEKIYPVHELELYAIVHALKTWRHYLGERHFVILADSASLKFFETQPNLSTQQARWQAFLAQFHYELKYQKGHNNIVADALSRCIY
jgi:hypothetical protein